MAVAYRQFQPGQKVRNQFGEIRTVLNQVGCQVFVEEECNGHYHPSKLFLVDEGPNTSESASRLKCIDDGSPSFMHARADIRLRNHIAITKESILSKTFSIVPAIKAKKRFSTFTLLAALA